MKVIVITCDKYSWLIPTFLHFYEKNWPDNPYQIEFVTETKEVEGMTTFCAGKLQWADRIIKYLKTYNEETFLLLVEDYILKEKVDTNRIKKAENLCGGDIGCVRLNPHDGLSRFLVSTKIEGFKEYPLDKPYSISLQPSIWQKEFFLKFLRKGETVWQTEIKGSKRIHVSKKKVIWTDIPIITQCRPCGYIQKGKIIKSVERWVKENW